MGMPVYYDAHVPGYLLGRPLRQGVVSMVLLEIVWRMLLFESLERFQCRRQQLPPNHYGCTAECRFSSCPRLFFGGQVVLRIIRVMAVEFDSPGASHGSYPIGVREQFEKLCLRVTL